MIKKNNNLLKLLETLCLNFLKYKTKMISLYD